MLLVCDVGGGTTVGTLFTNLCLWLLIRNLGLECSQSYEHRRHGLPEFGANGCRTGYFQLPPLILDLKYLIRLRCYNRIRST